MPDATVDTLELKSAKCPNCGMRFRFAEDPDSDGIIPFDTKLTLEPRAILCVCGTTYTIPSE